MKSVLSFFVLVAFVSTINGDEVVKDESVDATKVAAAVSANTETLDRSKRSPAYGIDSVSASDSSSMEAYYALSSSYEDIVSSSEELPTGRGISKRGRGRGRSSKRARGRGASKRGRANKRARGRFYSTG